MEGGNLKGRRLFGQVVCSFRYGREEDEVMGLQFQKDLLMASGEIKETCNHELTKMQVIHHRCRPITVLPRLMNMSLTTSATLILKKAHKLCNEAVIVAYQNCTRLDDQVSMLTRIRDIISPQSL